MFYNPKVQMQAGISGKINIGKIFRKKPFRFWSKAQFSANF